MEFIKNGGAIIQKMIYDAKGGSNTVTVTGNYEIEKEIRVPSDFHIILENCHLRQGNGTFCNIFINENCRTDLGREKEGRNRNIIIEGRGKAILDGGEYNGLSEKTSLKNGMPHISFNSLMYFANVEGFEVKNIHMRNQRYWAMTFVFCSDGKIKDIDFCSNPTVIDENGNISIGAKNYEDRANFLVKNADGIDLRVGCHDIIIENITGFCQDDTIAFTGLNMGEFKKSMYEVEGECHDMYNLIVRNVNACSSCSVVRLLNQGGVKLYNVLIDGVFDSSKTCPYMDRGIFGVRVGDMRMYGSRHATSDECFNITIKNLFSRAQNVLGMAGDMKDIYLENIRGFDGNENFIIDNTSLEIEKLIKN